MEKLVNLCILAMIDYGVITKEQKAIVRYGLDLLFSAIISLVSFAVLGMILGVEVQTLLLLAVFIPLQSFGGGYHCQTHFRCWILMLVDYILAIFVSGRVPMGLLWCGGILSSFSFCKLAPIENPKAPFCKGFQKKMHKIVIEIYIITMLIAILMFVCGIEWGRLIFAAVSLSGFSIMFAKVDQLKRIKK